MDQEVLRWKYPNNSKKYKGFRKTIENVMNINIMIIWKQNTQ